MDIFIPARPSIETVTVPPSKSFAQRAILAAALGKTPITITNIGHSDDVLHLVTIARQLGAETMLKGGNVRIEGGQYPVEHTLHCGESGLGIRIVTSVAAALKGDFTLTGTGSLSKRPLNAFHDFLPQLGVNCESDKGFLPLKISGNARAGQLEVNGSLSSQYLSGLLMATPLLDGPSTITANNLKSQPYITITLEVLKAFGIQIEHKNNYAHFSIAGKQQYTPPLTYPIEGDYSGASIWMVYGALNGPLRIEGLNPISVQADQQMLKALDAAGVSFTWQDDCLVIQAAEKLHPFQFDANECPDLFPALAVLAAGCEGTSVIKGAKRLPHKESNRGLVLQTELGKLGLSIELNGDEMHIFGTGRLHSGTIDSNNDHRIAMAGAIAALLTDKGVTITQAESVSKSYPDFWTPFNIG